MSGEDRSPKPSFQDRAVATGKAEEEEEEEVALVDKHFSCLPPPHSDARRFLCTRMASAGTQSGIWKKDSVKVSLCCCSPPPFQLADPPPPQDVAESVGIANLPDEVATALAGDVEYRLWEIIEVGLTTCQTA